MVVGFFIMSVVSSVFSYFSSYSFVLIFIVVAGFIYLFLKGAYFIFFNKLWSFLHRDEFYDSYLDSERKNTLDVERFKIMFGMNRIDDIQTVRDAHRAIKWSSSRSIALRALGKAGRWVDWENQKVKEPPAFYRYFILTVALVVLMLLMFSAGFAFSSKVLVRFEESGTWAWQGEDYFIAFKPTNEKSWVLGKKDCFGGVKKVDLPLTADEIDYMCWNMGSESFSRSFRSGVSAQNYFGFFAFFVFLYFLIVFRIELLSISTALRVYKQVNKK